MDMMDSVIAGVVCILLGVVLVKTRDRLGAVATRLYQKAGVEVPKALYIKQIMFVGVLLIIFGFIVATGLVRYL